ncbi:MAG: RtcB family protein [Nitrospinae bacterium]|nr:RtcB family protein [Nitrospinota bacterium]
MYRNKLRRTGEVSWEIPADSTRGMLVPAKIFASEEMLPSIDDSALTQISNAATLPGVVLHTVAMPDIHSGYGLPIGGVMATDPVTGVVSPGAAGYDINCGVRIMRTPINFAQASAVRGTLAERLMTAVPGGVGRGGVHELEHDDYRNIAEHGAGWAVNKGLGFKDDLANCESNGRLEGAELKHAGNHAMKRGRDQMGTLGSGNHFCEIQHVDEIYDQEVADKWGLSKGQILVMIHTGSRGFGHQVATEYLETMEHAMKKYGITVPDRELACAPMESEEGREYLSAMRTAANYAWANRQVIMHSVRTALADIFHIEPESMRLLYDVAHNIIKIERHLVNGKQTNILVHRKGATRSFPAGNPELADVFKETGQPVLVPGDMGRMSFLLAGSAKSMDESFGSSCHGAGRRLSRHQALKQAGSGKKIQEGLSARGIEVRAAGRQTLAEEMPDAYKDVSQVVDVVATAGLAKMVARMRPVVVIKG